MKISKLNVTIDILYQTQARSLPYLVTESLTDSCCRDLTDLTLACEDARVAVGYFMDRLYLSFTAEQNKCNALMPEQNKSHVVDAVDIGTKQEPCC